MPFSELTEPPTAPSRADDPETFVQRADAFVDWQETFADQIVLFIAELETAAALIAAAPEYADPGLVAMTGKTPAADRFIYFNGASTSALATLTTAARALLDDADASTMLTTLGVSTFAKTLLDDTTAGGVLTTLGISAFAQTILDDANAGAVLTTLGLTANGQSLVTAADYAAMRVLLGLVIGTNVAAAGANTDITALDQDVTITATGTIAANSIGYRGLPSSAQATGSGITLALADAGKVVPNTTGGWTIPANGSIAFPIGTKIALYNDSGSSQALAITSDTLRWGGSASTGTRDVLQYGVAELLKVASTTWVVTGNLA